MISILQCDNDGLISIIMFQALSVINILSFSGGLLNFFTSYVMLFIYRSNVMCVCVSFSTKSSY